MEGTNARPHSPILPLPYLVPWIATGSPIVWPGFDFRSIPQRRMFYRGRIRDFCSGNVSRFFAYLHTFSWGRLTLIHQLLYAFISDFNCLYILELTIVGFARVEDYMPSRVIPEFLSFLLSEDECIGEEG